MDARQRDGFRRDEPRYRFVPRRVTDANGCRDSVDVFVNDANPVSLVIAGPPVICTGQTVTLFATAIGTRPPYTFTWSDGSTLDSLVVQPSDTTSYEVYVTDSAGCRGEPVEITVNVYPPLDLSLDALPAICAGDSVLLHAVAGGGNGGQYSYSWNNGAVPRTKPRPIRHGFFLRRDGFGWMQSRCPRLGIGHRLSAAGGRVHADQFFRMCAGGCQLRQPHRAALGQYLRLGLRRRQHLHRSGPRARVHRAGCVRCIARHNERFRFNENRLTVDSAVVVYAWPVADFDQSAATLSVFTPLLELFDRSDLSASWQWDYGDGTVDTGVVNPQHQYADTGTYQIRLIVQSPGGCPDTAYGTVRIDQELTLYIPNAFTPNGDGKNDGFIAVGIGVVEYEMWIIDRWGREIYHSTRSSQPWDGSYKGGNPTCQADVYEYVIPASRHQEPAT